MSRCGSSTTSTTGAPLRSIVVDVVLFFFICLLCTSQCFAGDIESLTDQNFYEYYTTATPDTVIVTLFYAFHDNFNAPHDLQLIEDLADEYSQSRLNLSSSTSFGSFFYPPQHAGEAHWYPEPIPLPVEEKLAVMAPPPVFTVNNQESPANPQATDQKPQSTTYNEVMQRLLSHLAKMEHQVREKLGMQQDASSALPATTTTPDQTDASGDKTTSTNPPAEGEEPTTVQDQEKIVTIDTTLHTSDETAEAFDGNPASQNETTTDITNSSHHDEVTSFTNASDGGELEVVEQQPHHNYQQQRVTDKHIRFTSATLYSKGRMAETFPIWILPSFEFFRTSISIVPGETKQEVFQFRYPGIFGKSWLASYLKREMRPVEYFPPATSMNTILRWLHSHVIVEDLVMVGIFADTASQDYSLFLQAAQQYNQMYSFAAIHMPPRQFVEALLATDDDVTLMDIHTQHTTSNNNRKKGDEEEEDDDKVEYASEKKERMKDLRRMKRELASAVGKHRNEETKRANKIQVENTTSTTSPTTHMDSAIIIMRHLRTYRHFVWPTPESQSIKKASEEMTTAEKGETIENSVNTTTEEHNNTHNTDTHNNTNTNSTTLGGASQPNVNTVNSISRQLFYWIGNHSFPILEFGTDHNVALAAGYGRVGQAAVLVFIDLTNHTQKQVFLLRARTNAVHFQGKLNFLLFDSNYFSAFKERLGITMSVGASLLAGKEELIYNYPYDDGFFKLGQFCEDYLNGLLSPYRRSTPFKRIDHLDRILGGVVPVSYDTFQQIVLDPTKDVLVKYIQPVCGLCKVLIPVFHDLVKEFSNSPEVLFAMYDVSTNDLPVEFYDHRGFIPNRFPAILFFGRKNKAAPIIYEGDYSVEAIAKFVNTHRTPTTTKSTTTTTRRKT